MKTAEITYPPLDVPKPVAEGVWVVDSGPLRAMGFIPVPVRMTVLRLDSGALMLHSPTRCLPSLRDRLSEFGRIAHLIAPNLAHWTSLPAWQAEFPEATTWAAPGLRGRRAVKRSGVRLDHDLGARSPDAWAGEVEQIPLPGAGGFVEIAFFHRASRTMVLTDLVQNLEAGKLPLPLRAFGRLAGNTAPDGRAPVYLRALVRMRGSEARQAARRLVALRPERVVFAHGRWFERDAAGRLERSLRWLL